MTLLGGPLFVCASCYVPEEWLKWECPVCGDVSTDPNDFRSTECHNGHEVQLGHDRGDGWQDAYTAQPAQSTVE